MSIKKPKPLLGYVMFKNEEYPFEFIEEDFRVILFPPTREKWNEYSSPFTFFSNIQEKNKKNNKKEWIESFELEGITSEHYKVVFSVSDAPSNYHGFISYEVNWYFYCQDYFDFSQVSGFRLSGREIDCFYPPQVALKNEVLFREDNSIEKMQVTTTSGDLGRDCGSYSIRRGLKARVEVNAFATMHPNTANNPIDAASYVYYFFSKPTGLKDIVISCYHIRGFFKYVAYRNNISFSSIETFILDEDGKRDFGGAIVFKEKNQEDDEKKATERIIKYDILGENSSKLLTAIKSGKLGFAHISESIDGRRHYSSGRMIMIMAEFEREFRSIYGTDYGRSELYKSTKEQIITLVEEYRVSHTGDAKKYAQSIKKTIQNLDNSFADNVEKAISDCRNIIGPFIKNNYKGEIDLVIKDLSCRVGEIRNGIAHSKMDFKLDAIHLTDLKIIEELIYVMRLKKVGVKDEKIINGISSLFCDNARF